VLRRIVSSRIECVSSPTAPRSVHGVHVDAAFGLQWHLATFGVAFNARDETVARLDRDPGAIGATNEHERCPRVSRDLPARRRY